MALMLFGNDEDNEDDDHDSDNDSVPFTENKP